MGFLTVLGGRYDGTMDWIKQSDRRRRPVRETNRRMLLQRLLEVPGGLTRTELARDLSLSVPAIATLVGPGESGLKAVLKTSLATEDPTRAPAAGPPPGIIRIKPDIGHVVGIVIGHRHVEVAHADLYGQYDPTTDAKREDWDTEGDLHGALRRASQLAESLADDHRHQVGPKDIAAIGLSVAAPVQVFNDGQKQRALIRVNLGGRGSSRWHHLDPIVALKSHLKALDDGHRWSAIDLHVDNDANLGALAESRLGAGRGCENILYVRFEHGSVGAGLVLDGRVYRGSGGIAGEFGHLVLEPGRSNVECDRCGHPCVEAVIRSILGFTTDAIESPVARLVRAAVDGDPGSIESLQQIADYVGQALAGLVTVLNVDRILVGGPFPAQAYDLVIPFVQQALERLTTTPAARDYVVELGSLQGAATLEGALQLALERRRIDYLLERASVRHAKHTSARARPRTSSPAQAPRAQSQPPRHPPRGQGI